MKATKIKEVLLRHDELKNIIINLQIAIDDLDKPGKKRELAGRIYLSGTTSFYDGKNLGDEVVNVFVSQDATKIIKNDLRAVLVKHLKKLQQELDALEVK